MTTDPQPDAEPELTDVQKAYNVAQSGLFHLAAYGHFRYWPTGHALPGTEDDARRKGYCARINMAREHLEAAVLRLVAEHAETFRGDWGIVAAWLRSLADDPAELSLLAVRPDERPATVASAAVPSAPADRTAELSPAERTMLNYALNQAQLRMWATGKFTDEDQAAVVSLRRMADEAPAQRNIQCTDAFWVKQPHAPHDWQQRPDAPPVYCPGVDGVAPAPSRAADEAQQPETQAAPDPSWPRRAWNLGLLHKGGDPHHCPACVAQPEPPKDFICPGAEANAEVLANPQPAVGAQQPKEADGSRTVCVCGHTRAEHLVVGGRLLCDECDPDSTNNLVCKEFEAL